MTGFTNKIESILDAIKGRKILIVGDAMLDNYIWGDASRISPEAPVPVVKVEEETCVAGGAANVALNVTSLGGRASLFALLGDDASGAKLRGKLDGAGVALLDGCVSAARRTIVKTRIICRRQQLCRLDMEDPPAKFALSDGEIAAMLAPILPGFDAVIISDYGKGLVNARSAAALRAAIPAGKFTALDPKPRPGISYPGFSVMTPNLPEACALAGLSADTGAEPADAFRIIKERFAPDNLVVTMGAQGMLVGAGDAPPERIPTVAREVFDVSGAGDSVIAALTLASAAGIALGDAARFANTVAGFVVGKLGTATATPDDIRRYAAPATA